MIWLTSDLHLGHEAAIRLSGRPFSNVEEMNRCLVGNYNQLVTGRDTVYILGDLTYRIKEKEANELVSKLNGKKILIRGNHDRVNYDATLFTEICDLKKLRYQHCKFILMHYLLAEWEGKEHYSIHLHGHIHSKGRYNQENIRRGIRQYDVGVDANYFEPVNLDELVRLFADAPLISPVDRHNYDETAGETVGIWNQQSGTSQIAEKWKE